MLMNSAMSFLPSGPGCPDRELSSCELLSSRRGSGSEFVCAPDLCDVTGFPVPREPARGALSGVVLTRQALPGPVALVVDWALDYDHVHCGSPFRSPLWRVRKILAPSLGDAPRVRTTFGGPQVPGLANASQPT